MLCSIPQSWRLSATFAIPAAAAPATAATPAAPAFAPSVPPPVRVLWADVAALCLAVYTRHRATFAGYALAPLLSQSADTVRTAVVTGLSVDGASAALDSEVAWSTLCGNNNGATTTATSSSGCARASVIGDSEKNVLRVYLSMYHRIPTHSSTVASTDASASETDDSASAAPGLSHDGLLSCTLWHTHHPARQAASATAAAAITITAVAALGGVAVTVSGYTTLVTLDCARSQCSVPTLLFVSTAPQHSRHHQRQQQHQHHHQQQQQQLYVVQHHASASYVTTSGAAASDGLPHDSLIPVPASVTTALVRAFDSAVASASHGRSDISSRDGLSLAGIAPVVGCEGFSASALTVRASLTGTRHAEPVSVGLSGTVRDVLRRNADFAAAQCAAHCAAHCLQSLSSADAAKAAGTGSIAVAAASKMRGKTTEAGASTAGGNGVGNGDVDEVVRAKRRAMDMLQSMLDDSDSVDDDDGDDGDGDDDDNDDDSKAHNQGNNSSANNAKKAQNASHNLHSNANKNKPQRINTHNTHNTHNAHSNFTASAENSAVAAPVAHVIPSRARYALKNSHYSFFSEPFFTVPLRDFRRVFGETPQVIPFAAAEDARAGASAGVQRLIETAKTVAAVKMEMGRANKVANKVAATAAVAAAAAAAADKNTEEN